MPEPLLVVAVGGNALLRPGDPIDGNTQQANAARAAAALSEIAGARDGRLVVTHGSGPQVGLLGDVQDLPLALLDAEAAGLIGHLLGQELANELAGREVVTVLTHLEVDPADPAFADPTKPIGPAGHRRLVASPDPTRIVELGPIQQLVEAGVIVVCAGGGGIPVTTDASTGRMRTVDAVIDKDLATALLAIGLGATQLVLLTDVDGVYSDWGTDAAARLDRAEVAELRAGSFASGSMGPKVEAACRFVERTGSPAHIGALDDASRVAAGEAGTLISP